MKIGLFIGTLCGMTLAAATSFAGCPDGLKPWPAPYNVAGTAKPAYACATSAPALAPVEYKGRDIVAMTLPRKDLEATCEKSVDERIALFCGGTRYFQATFVDKEGNPLAVGDENEGLIFRQE